MENIIKVILGETEIKENDEVLEFIVKSEKDRLDEIIPVEEFKKGIEMIPEGTEMKRGTEMVLAYVGKYRYDGMTYRDLYKSLKESEQLALSESLINMIEEFKNMFSPAQA